MEKDAHRLTLYSPCAAYECTAVQLLYCNLCSCTQSHVFFYDATCAHEQRHHFFLTMLCVNAQLCYCFSAAHRAHPGEASSTSSASSASSARRGHSKLAEVKCICSFKDMGLLIGCSYLMEGVESGLEAVRGTRDRYNKLCGGVAAGGVLGFAWYPRHPYARLAMTGTGALVGYLSYLSETASRRLLLDRQHKLEQELLGLPPQLHKQDLDPVYLQELFRIRQKQQIVNGVPERERKVTELDQLFRPHAQPQAPSSIQGLENGGDPATSAGNIWADGFEESVTSEGAAPAEQPMND
ncbi:hypothetical protein DUNSADRAFT_15864 [Dunaliella salina]|uniref:Uncharacterized protein n=1 Tax=Dunaliella salina TaxID=3046 RepID=A0ABQ7G4T6_DUNSA|nr:hypothetical protein DUNSADRAFT_15864 [Dunaliella salina]|eukprot:KAF5829599.1 hypothetical protein DUNSADRAFT_15864 [Dunaliella salina]